LKWFLLLYSLIFLYDLKPTIILCTCCWQWLGFVITVSFLTCQITNLFEFESITYCEAFIYISPGLWKLVVQNYQLLFTIHEHNIWIATCQLLFVYAVVEFLMYLYYACSITDDVWQVLVFDISNYALKYWNVKLIKCFCEAVLIHLTFLIYITKLQPVNDQDFYLQGTILVSGA